MNGHAIVIVLVVLLLLGAFGSYRGGGAYRTYGTPGLGVIVIVLLLLWVFGVL